ncbi:MAG: hypothetical protein AAB618_03985 [Patescibacteria group bacterium]
MADKAQKSLVLHAYHFVKEHWGEMYVAFDIARGFFVKEKPSDNAHDIVKLVHGGKNSIEDEIAYEPLELMLTAEEYALMGKFRTWAKAQLGTGLIGKQRFANWDNNFRQMILRRREPSRIEYDTATLKDAKGRDVVKKSERLVPVNNQPAVDFLRRFTAEMQRGINGLAGDETEKMEAGCLKANSYLIRFNLPFIRQDSTLKRIDEAFSGLPQKGTSLAVNAVARNQTLNQSTAIKEAGLPLWRRLMRF